MGKSAFGPIVCGGDVRRAAQETVALWIKTYVDEMSRVSGVTLPYPRSYGAVGDPSDTHLMPAVVIVAPGMSRDPERHGDGNIDATWGLGVGALVAHAERDTALYHAELYGAALRTLIVQNPSLNGFASLTRFQDEETTIVSWDTGINVASCALVFDVVVRGISNDTYGLAAPPVDTTVATDYVDVSSVNVQY